MDPLSTLEIGLRLGAALALGAMVGLERERKHRPAGFRTMILISLGSAAFVVVGVEGVRTMVKEISDAGLANSISSAQANAVGQAEISRVLQGLIGGIGFLGAGAVIQNKRAVRGLTTAAAVWVTAAIGAACGLGFYKIAGLVAVFTLFTLVILEMVENRYFPDPEDFEDTFKKKNGKSAEENGPMNSKE
jgi:putative Mg2+ transporter-C (MgtC) family protein